MSKKVGWVVDCQVDFLDPTGRLYVKDLGDDGDVGSVQIIPVLRESVDWMTENCAVTVFTGDWHGLEDEEIDPETPDPAAGTYPPHCMGRSEDPAERAGAEVIVSLRPDDPLVLGVTDDAERGEVVAREAATSGRPVFIQKTRFDVFAGNAATERFLEVLTEELGGDVEIVVIGVARDVCVTQAVDGMQARDHSVIALSDATWGLGLESEAETLARWSREGRVTTLAGLKAAP